MINCSESREKLKEIKTLRDELALRLPQAQNEKDTFVLVNLRAEIEDKLREFEDLFIVSISEIERKGRQGKSLSRREIKFIYQLGELFDEKLEVKEEDNVKERRYKFERRLDNNRRKKDLARVFGCRESQISLTEEEAISGDIVYHPYDIFIESKSAKGLTLPKLIGGNLYLGRLASVENLKLPNYIGGYLDLSGITNAKGLNLPKYIGRLGLFKLVSIKDLNLEDVKIKEDIYFNNISKEQRKQLKSKYPHLADKIV